MKQVATDSVHRPSLALLGTEPFRAAMEFACHKLGKSDDAKPGDGHPVVIFPGLGAHGGSVATLREHCRSLGYDAFDWGQGFNTGPQGDLDAWLHTLKSQVVDRLAGHTQPATLIGWSLGGLYAREIGKLMAPRIRQVSLPTRHDERGAGIHSDAHAGAEQRSLGTARPGKACQFAVVPTDTPSPSKALTMALAHIHRPHHPNHDVPEEFERGAPPVEPDEGPVPAHIPDDPENEPVIAPGPNHARPAKRTRRQDEVATPLLGAKAPQSATGLALPHERDESAPAAAVVPDPVMVQAKRNIDAGRVDTDMRATPGLDAKLHARLVPRPGGKPASTGA
ncbi:MAG: hypothetical protein Q8M01_22015 [Rubrivivax sp.]|nr:hypothetical protein [Rubrivivax sp.]